MKLDKPPVDFHTLDIDEGWTPAPGAAPRIEQKLLSGELDEINKVGARTRLIRFLPGAVAPAPFAHDYWKEVYLIQGQLTVGNDPEGEGGATYDPPSYACRPPGTYHGPFTSKAGCLFLEIQYCA